MESSDIPLWPVKHSNGPRRMCFLSGEARWYLWLQEGNRQAITSLRRDLLLLHQNGDLQLFRNKIPPGTYIAALHDQRMMRGRVCPTQNTTDCSRHVTAIDVDEGLKLNLPLSQVRVLPPEMKSLPCQAVRVDIGLDCIEQFDWPEQLNTMLMKAIGKALIFVDIKSKRPGSIPTIDADVTIVNPGTGQSITIQKWLIDYFSHHLDLCGLERFKPFPVGMSAGLMVNNMPIFQQPVFGFGMPGSSSPNIPSGLPSILPSSGIQAGMPLGMPPSFPVPLPPPQAGQPLIMTHGMPYSMSPRCPISLPPSGGRMPPSMSQCTQPSPNIFPTPTPPGSTISATLMSFSVMQPVRPAPPPPHHQMPFKDSIPRQKSANNSSTGPSATSSIIFESDSSLTCDSDCPPHSESTVGIDLNESFKSSSSSGPNPYAPPFFPRDHTPPEMTQSAKVVELEECPTSPTSPSRGVRGAVKVEKRSSHRSAEAAARGAVKDDKRYERDESSSGLSVEAAPFVPKDFKKKMDIVMKPDPEPNLNHSAGRVDESAEKPRASPTKTAITSTHSESPSLKDGQTPTPLLPLKNAKICQPGPVPQFSKGKQVQLKQIVRDWKVGQVVPAFMARVWNPSCFEVNVIDEFSGLLSNLQTEMNGYYKCGINKLNMSSKQQARDSCGDFCACYDADEDLWFRAQVNEWFMEDSVTPLKVWAVDYGGYSQVDLGSVQPLATELACTAPILVTLCSMKNIISRHDYDIWPAVHLNRVKEIMPEDNQLFLRIDGPKSSDDIWPVSVFKDPDCSMQSINEILVAEGCAHYVGMAKESSDVSLTSIYEDAENPMAEAYELGGNNYDIDDEDACVAVSGRKPTDETGICWFFQRNGYCYKKFCDLRHERLDPDGHSIAKEPMHHDSFEKLTDNVLSPGTQVKLTVTRIMTVHHFIATVSTKGTKLRSRETLKSVIENLNSTQMKRQLKTFTEFPADGEIVLFKDNTGMFYRGRVICADMVTDNLYKILNVDTGYKHKIPLKDLRRVDPAFLHHPFQAMECWLADVAPTQNDREWTKTCNAVFADLVQNEKLFATVVRSSPWGIEVNLVNKNGHDIAVLLKEMGIVKSCARRHLPLDESNHVPG